MNAVQAAWMLALSTMHLNCVDGAATMGPAEFNVKISEKCGFTPPNAIDMSLRIIQRRGKTIVNLRSVSPYKFSDKLGYSIIIDVKRNGAWKSNFFKSKGQGVCSGLRVIQPEFFALAAKSMNAPEPYSCPLPAGTIEVTGYSPDMGSFQSVIGGVLPYGEFRANMNMTHNNDVIMCAIYYVDIVPKQAKKKG